MIDFTKLTLTDVAALAAQGCVVQFYESGAVKSVTFGMVTLIDSHAPKSSAARRQAAYRERQAALKTANEHNAGITKRNENATSDETPSPSFPLSPLSPNPPIPTHTHTPPPTRAREEQLTLSDEEETPKPPKPWNPTPEQIEVASWFSRRPTTRWSRDEASLWKKLQPIATDDWEAAKWYYSESGCPYLRKDLQTLLNNWNGEVDRAKNYDPERDKRR